MKFWKKIIVLFSIILLSAFFYAWNLYHKKPADVRQQKPQAELQAADLLSAFKFDEAEASKKYIGKIITVSGTIHHVDLAVAGTLTMYLDAGDPSSGIVCSFYADERKALNNLSKGKLVRVKGYCTGMLMDVVLNKCSMAD